MEKIPLMDEERVNWYLRNVDRPGFIKAIGKDWSGVREKLIYSLQFYGIDIPEVIREPWSPEDEKDED